MGFCCGFSFLPWVLIGYGGGADWVWVGLVVVLIGFDGGVD